MPSLSPQSASIILRKLVLIGAQAADAAKALTVGMEMAEAAKTASPIATLQPSGNGHVTDVRMRADAPSPQEHLSRRAGEALSQAMILAQELVGHAAAMADQINEMHGGEPGGLKLMGG